MKRRIETHPETHAYEHIQTINARASLVWPADEDARAYCFCVLLCALICVDSVVLPGLLLWLSVFAGFLFGARRTAAAESGYWRCRRWTAAEDDGRPPPPIKSPAKKAQGHSLSGMALGLICFGSAPYASGKSVTSGSWPDGRRPARWDRPPGTARCSRARRCRSQGPRGVPRCRLRCTA